MDSKFPMVGLGVMIKKNDKVLLLKRKGAHGSGTWCFPGGHLEYGETFEACAKRETLEEGGIKIKNVRFASATNNIFPEGKHYVTIFMLAEWDEGEAVIGENDKCDAIGWFSPNDLPKPLFFPTENFLCAIK
ncbi:MAG: NUDIX domain-containing protein [Candidatus Aenigmarchaeota archaeon]|nr:NUDIX domain-containing protein [Candidatus Aenigmarchaeota archaeon]